MQQNEVHRTEGRGAICNMSNVGVLLGGIGVGAALMYLLDPERGRTRRARLSDQVTSKANRFGDAAAAQARDLRNRAQGFVHEAGGLFRGRGSAEGDGDAQPNQHVLGAPPVTPTPAQGM